MRLKSWIQKTFIIISDTILICLSSCFVLFCLLYVCSLLSIYHSLSIYLFVCLPVLSNLHFGIDFGRNDPGPKRPRAESTHLPRPKRPIPKLGRNDPGRNDPGRNDPGPKRPGFFSADQRLYFRLHIVHLKDRCQINTNKFMSSTQMTMMNLPLKRNVFGTALS